MISDVTMPNMRGDELAWKLLRIRPDIPIILCSGFSESITKDKALRPGVREHLMKPLVLRDLAEAIRTALGKGDSPLNNPLHRIVLVLPGARTLTFAAKSRNIHRSKASTR